MPDFERLKLRLNLVGNICGVLGASLCIVASVLRLILGARKDVTVLAPNSLLLLGIAIMVFGCWAKLAAKP